jgi:quercetin dioxygenase-like cupin family protein
MEIKRSGSQPSGKGPAEYFTGAVRIDPLFEAPEPARVRSASVTFEPAARTAWHTHPLGQTLIVTAGCGWTQCWGGPKQEIRPGDVLLFIGIHNAWDAVACHVFVNLPDTGSPIQRTRVRPAGSGITLRSFSAGKGSPLTKAPIPLSMSPKKASRPARRCFQSAALVTSLRE